jgi:hypothetical protein
MQGLAERGDIPAPSPVASDVSERRGYGINIVDFLAQDDDESDDDEWIVRGLIPAGVPSIIGGPPKSKKTFLLLYSAICVAAGRDVLGCRTSRGRVLVICREDSARTIRRRIRRLARGLAIDPAELREWLRVDAVKPLYLDRDSDVEELYETIDEFRPALVAIDCLSRIHFAKENDASDLRVVTNRWMDICTRFTCGVSIIHHDRKGASHGHDPGAALRGSGDLHALVRGVVGCEPKGDINTIKIVAAGNLDAFCEPFAVRYTDSFTPGDPPQKVLRLERVSLDGLRQHKDAAASRDVRQDVLQAFAREGAFPSGTALAGAVGRSKAAVLRVVSDLVGEKLIRRDGNALSPINLDRILVAAAIGGVS